MQNLIGQFIETVHTNFLEREWCDLNNTELNINNYQDECQQEYYLLKYFPAYVSEYYTMYTELFEIYTKEHIKIISIGCAAGIDYYALDGIENKPIVDYFGIDIINWQNRPDFQFLQSDIAQLESNIFDNVDLIVLPKVLTELTNEKITDLATKIVNANLSNELYFLNSYITDDSHDSSRIDGISKFEIICKKLQENGYTITEENTCNKYTYFKEHKGIRSHIDFFVYPNDTKDFLHSLKNHCALKNNEDAQCMKCNIGDYPMMNSKYIAFNVLKFVKNDN